MDSNQPRLQSLEDNAQRLSLLADTSRYFADLRLGTQETLQGVAQRCAEVLGDACTIQLLNEDKTAFRVEAYYHRDPQAVEFARQLFLGQLVPKAGLSGRVVDTGETAFMPTVEPEALLHSTSVIYRKYLMQFPVFSAVVAPLRTPQGVIGVISLTRNARNNPYSDLDCVLLQDLAERASLAIQNVTLLQEHMESGRRADVLQGIVAALAKTISSKEVGETVVEHSIRAFDAAFGFVYVLGSDGQQVKYLATPPSTQANFANTETLVSLGAQLPAALRLNDHVFLETREQVLACFTGAISNKLVPHAEAALMVAMRVRDRVVGGIALVFTRPRLFTDRDRKLADSIANESAHAIDRALLVDDLRDAIVARDEFLAMAGHELKTPLTALLMYIQSINRGKEALPPKVAERLHKIQGVSSRLESLINQMLDLSRIATDKFKLDCELFPIDALLHEVVDSFAELAAQSKPTFHVRTQANLMVYWDKARIEQVIANLVSNAVKYGGGKSIDIDLYVQDELLPNSDAEVVLRIRDRGIGIAIDQQERIFERFERGAISREVGGFGVGLWICRRIVEAAQGSIEVDSTPGNGATFTVRLPQGLVNSTQDFERDAPDGSVARVDLPLSGPH